MPAPGTGRWQKVILEATRFGQPCYLLDLLPDEATRTEYKTLYAAMTKLYRRGRISRWHVRIPGRRGRPRVIIARPGAEQTIPEYTRAV